MPFMTCCCVMQVRTAAHTHTGPGRGGASCAPQIESRLSQLEERVEQVVRSLDGLTSLLSASLGVGVDTSMPDVSDGARSSDVTTTVTSAPPPPPPRTISPPMSGSEEVAEERTGVEEPTDMPSSWKCRVLDYVEKDDEVCDEEEEDIHSGEGGSSRGVFSRRASMIG
jgi:hypothetical protein